MSFPARIDGIGTRINSSGEFNEVNKGGQRVRTVSLFASEAIAKGDALCFDFASTGSDYTDFVDTTTHGHGTTVKKVAADTLLTSQCIGIAAQATTDVSSVAASTAAPVLIQVQVSGVCDFAKIDGSATAPGQLLIGGNATDGTNGLLCAIDTGANQGSGGQGDQLPVAIHIFDDGNDGADGRCFLLNPANL